MHFQPQQHRCEKHLGQSHLDVAAQRRTAQDRVAINWQRSDWLAAFAAQDESLVAAEDLLCQFRIQRNASRDVESLLRRINVCGWLHPRRPSAHCLEALGEQRIVRDPQRQHSESHACMAARLRGAAWTLNLPRPNAFVDRAHLVLARQLQRLHST